MNKFNNPRLTNTTVSGTGVKHPMRPHVILGDPENGFIRGDLLDANAVIKLIKNAAKAIGALEELEQSNWIDDNAKTEEPAEETVGVLQEGEVGFFTRRNERFVVQLTNGDLHDVVYREGSTNYALIIESDQAFGKSLSAAYAAGYIVKGHETIVSGAVDYSTVSNVVVRNATRL